MANPRIRNVDIVIPPIFMRFSIVFEVGHIPRLTIVLFAVTTRVAGRMQPLRAIVAAASLGSANFLPFFPFHQLRFFLLKCDFKAATPKAKPALPKKLCSRAGSFWATSVAA